MRQTAAFDLFLAVAAVTLLAATGLSPAAAEDNYSAADLQREHQKDDEELNQAYQEAREHLGEAGKSALKTAERAWIAFKEKDDAIFFSLAKAAHDVDRILLYESEANGARIDYLNGVGQPNSGPTDSKVKTAREADQMLNSIYRQCIGMLPVDKAQSLKAAQADWIAYRDLHCQFDTAFKGGRANDYVLRDVTMTRVVEFRHYVRVLLSMQLPAPEDATEAKDEQEQAPSGTPPTDLYRFAR